MGNYLPVITQGEDEDVLVVRHEDSNPVIRERKIPTQEWGTPPPDRTQCEPFSRRHKGMDGDVSSGHLRLLWASWPSPLRWAHGESRASSRTRKDGRSPPFLPVDPRLKKFFFQFFTQIREEPKIGLSRRKDLCYFYVHSAGKFVWRSLESTSAKARRSPPWSPNAETQTGVPSCKRAIAKRSECRVWEDRSCVPQQVSASQ